MNTIIYTDLINISRKNVSDSWATEDYVDIGFVRGKLQTTGGSVGNLNGAVTPGASYVLYCPADSDIKLSDLLYDTYGRSFVVTAVQWNGVSGFGDHMEVGLAQR